MSYRLIVLLALLVGGVGVARAQGAIRTFQVVDGQVFVDGTHVPEAVPAGLDLSGMDSEVLQFRQPNLPVIEVDGQVFVLENAHLVPFEESSRAGQGIYMLYRGDETIAGIPEERTTPIVEAAYMREVASQNQALYSQLQREQELEANARALAGRVRVLPAGPERDRLRDELRGLLSDLLALKHQIRAGEIDMAQDRLDGLRARLEEREAQHDAIVDHRLRQLCGEE